MLALSSSGQLQSPHDEFPVHNPFTAFDTPENAQPYYAINLDFVNYNCQDFSCKQGSFQYNFEDGVADDNGNNYFDAYFPVSNSGSEIGPTPLVVLLHGNDGSRAPESGTTSPFTRLAQELVERGYGVIIPDYTTSRDDRWGDAFEDCFDQVQLYGVIQNAVKEVSASIRRALWLSSRTEDVNLDETSIFLVGNSFGAVVAAHLAYYEESEYPSVNNVSINDETYTFWADPENPSLDEYNICADAGPNCPNFLPGYKVRENIKGIALLSPMVLNPQAIDAEDYVPTLALHGTCDGLVPFDSPTAFEVSQRRLEYLGQDTEGGNPCENVPNLDYTIHGTFDIYRRIRFLKTTVQGFNPRFGIMALCGKDHNIGMQYLSRRIGGELFMGIADYEILRFFSLIMSPPDENSPYQFGSFAYSLDHNLHPLYDETANENYCASVPNRGDNDLTTQNTIYLNKLNRFACPSCAPDAPNYVGYLRQPVFAAVPGDAQRYPIISDPECPDEPAAVLDLFESAVSESVKVFNSLGEFMQEVRLSVPSGEINQALVERLSLPQGMYFLHFENGERKMMVVR
jgi:hypothetical protein